MMNISRPALLCSTTLMLAATNASATWSILIADTRTGEIVIGSATCVETIDLRQSTPVLISGVGAVTAQSAVDQTGFNRMLIRDRLLQRVPLPSILDELGMVDTGHGNRQYGFITAEGEQLTYSGFQNADWAGGITGRIELGAPGPEDDIVYSVQGNILSGENVVQDAVDAILNTESDLPGKLMAAMQAAKIAGGDGRCSCSNADPTGCGSPPPMPFKSAHVGYMLGTRSDDIDAVRAFYPITNNAGGMALVDLNHDGMQDVIIGDASNDEVSVFINTAAPNDPLSHVLLDEVINLSASGTVALRAGEFNDDGFQDIAIVSSTPPTLTVLLGNQDGQLDDPITYALQAVPTGMDTGNFGGSTDTIAVSLGSLDAVEMYQLNQGSILSVSTLAVDASPGALCIDQLSTQPNSSTSLMVAHPADSSIVVYQHEKNLNFGTPVSFTTAASPIVIKSHDLSGSEAKELIVLSELGRRAEVFTQNEDPKNPQWTRTNEITINREGRGLAIGDLTNDGLPDIITTSSSPQRNMQVFVNDGQGNFDFDSIDRVGSGSRFVELVDMNHNGDLDLVIGNSGVNGLLLLDNPRGAHIALPNRFANGNYFLELNIANQRQADPDPVDQLADLFSDWRSAQTGQVDAVQSTIVGRKRISRNMGSSVRIQLHDWQGNIVPITDTNAISIESQGSLVKATNIESFGPGVFHFDIYSDDQIGEQTFIIRIETDDGTVRLMPDYSVSVVENIVDFHPDGRFNFFDVQAFIRAAINREPDADINGTGVVDFHDIASFISWFPR